MVHALQPNQFYQALAMQVFLRTQRRHAHTIIALRDGARTLMTSRSRGWLLGFPGQGKHTNTKAHLMYLFLWSFQGLGGFGCLGVFVFVCFGR